MGPFEYRPVDVPRLAWCARVPREGGPVEVAHGPGVECRPGFFVEGAWSGPFEAGGFDTAAVFAGSGGRSAPGGVQFVTPSDLVDRLQYLESDEGLFVSNSLVFLLVRSGETLDPGYALYVRDLVTSCLGAERARDSVPLRSGRRLQVLRHERLLVRPGLRLERVPRPAGEPFTSYEGYVSHLGDATRALFENAADPARKVGYAPLATLSSGYDSPACAVIARDAGCREAITFREARGEEGEFESLDDSGAEIARILGLRVAELDRLAYLEAPDLAEAEFLAAGTGGGEVPLRVAEPGLPGRVLVTGYIGDSVWSVSRHREDVPMHRASGSGGSLCEFRLRAGFLHFPLPCVGGQQQASIRALSRSAALAPWRVGGGYDRPIPRRLVEEAGVPRSLFGQEKKAPTQPFNPTLGNARLAGRRLERIMSAASLRDFRRYREERHALPGAAARAGHAVRRALFRLRPPLPERLRAALRRPGIDRVRDRVQDLRYEFAFSEHDFLFHWAVERTRPRYEAGSAGALSRTT